MATRVEKTGRNKALKKALIDDGRTQRAIALATQIGEVRLSGIVNGHVSASDDEKAVIADALQRRVAEIFPEAAA